MAILKRSRRSCEIVRETIHTQIGLLYRSDTYLFTGRIVMMATGRIGGLPQHYESGRRNREETDVIQTWYGPIILAVYMNTKLSKVWPAIPHGGTLEIKHFSCNCAACVSFSGVDRLHTLEIKHFYWNCAACVNFSGVDRSHTCIQKCPRSKTAILRGGTLERKHF